MTTAGSPGVPGPNTTVRRWRSWRWAALALVGIAAVAAIGTYLTAPRTGGRLDPASTQTEGAHALVTLLRENGVEVVVANNIADVENAAASDALLVVAHGYYLAGDVLDRLAAVPGDLLLVDPTVRTRSALARGLRAGDALTSASEPNCALREANRAGTVEFGLGDTYRAASDAVKRTLVSCYGGALVRYRDDQRTITVVGGSDFMTNGGLLKEGNAALAMNLAGSHSRVVWYAPQRIEGETSSPKTIFDLMPDNVTWIVWQLVVTVLLVALWKARRIGPLVAEELPVVVRASETVEGRGRLYRSRRARDRAAQALRTATLQRMLPRLGLSATAPPTAVALAIAQRGHADPDWVRHTLFGPPPATEPDLVHLAHALDDIERQVANS